MSAGGAAHDTSRSMNLFQFLMSHIRNRTPDVAQEARETMGMPVEAIDKSNLQPKALPAVTLDDAG